MNTRGVKKDYAKLASGEMDASANSSEGEDREDPVPVAPSMSSERRFSRSPLRRSPTQEASKSVKEIDDEEELLVLEAEELDRRKIEAYAKLAEDEREKRKRELRERIMRTREEIKDIESGTHLSDTLEPALTKETGKHKSGGESTKKTPKVGGTKIGISDIRAMEALNRIVDEKMSHLGMCSTSEDSSPDSDSAQKKRPKGKTVKSRSGIRAKPSDRVIFPQFWPQSGLQLEYAGKNIRYKDLSFNQFVAGELEIIGSCETEEERIGRLSLLKKISYYYDIYDWRSLLDFYAAFVRRIELGQCSWGDSPCDLEVPLLAGHVRVKGKQNLGSTATRFKSAGQRPADSGTSATGEVFFCSMYQRNRCLSREIPT